MCHAAQGRRWGRAPGCPRQLGIEVKQAWIINGGWRTPHSLADTGAASDDTRRLIATAATEATPQSRTCGQLPLSVAIDCSCQWWRPPPV